MKKYVTPVTEILKLEVTNMVCASVTGGRENDFGAGGSGNPYANPDYDNEGNGGNPYDTGDDNGDLNSTGKDGSDPWDEVDDEE